MEEPIRLSDPVSLFRTLQSRGHPRLLWEPADDQRILQRIDSDPAARSLHQYLMTQADAMAHLPLPRRELQGIRMLEVSRRVLRHSTTLAYAWRLGGHKAHLDALQALLECVCQFKDWNPYHFLDTAEMAVAVALGLDWAHADLSLRTRQLCEEALFQHAVGPSFIPELASQLPLESNWNQVCNAGVIAAALVRDDPDASAAFASLQRLREWLPHVLATYAPAGVFPEGPSYWYYGTAYHVLLMSILESSLGTDFGLTAAPGFMESADAILQLTAPSGQYFNFGDCGEPPLLNEALHWFAWKKGHDRYLQSKAMHQLAATDMAPDGSAQRFAAISMLWYARSRNPSTDSIPDYFAAKGRTPVAVLRKDGVYVACKGGQAAQSHGHMDAGSFILEKGGVRWSCDPGNQPYEPLEAIMGGELWNMQNHSQRWSLLSKNNFGHSTLTLDGALHRAEGEVQLIGDDSSSRVVRFDLKSLYSPPLDCATREFLLQEDGTLEITDELLSSQHRRKGCWQLMTQAEVILSEREALLELADQQLRIRVLEPAGAILKAVYLDPPPLGHDLVIKDLKRLEIHFHLPTGIRTKVRVRIG